MKTVRIPDEGEVWYNKQTGYIYIMRDKVFRQLNVRVLSLIPNDSVILRELPELSCTFDDNFDIKIWVHLAEVAPNEYRWVPEISEATPKTGELWYYDKTGGYYVVDENGVFVLVYLFIFAQVSLSSGIRADKYLRDTNVTNGFAGWSLKSKDWKKFLMELFENSLNTPEKVLFGDTVQIQ